MSATLSIQRLSEAIAAEVQGIDLANPLDEKTRKAVVDALFEYQVLAFRNQSLTPTQYLQFGKYFGELEPFFISEYNLPDYPHIYVLSNVKKDGKLVGRYGAGMHWHSDSTFKKAPSSTTMLYAIQVPPEGGDTLFISNYDAYNKLPEAWKHRLEGLKAIHHYQTKEHLYTADRHLTEKMRQQIASYQMSGEQPQKRDRPKKQIPDVVHPIVRTHPITGRKALYLNEAMTSGITGMPDTEGQKLLQDLCDHAVKNSPIYRHKWQVGDVVIWDNASSMHTGTYADPKYARTMYRLTIQGSVPF
jgi:taurine dioxygenase